MLSGMLLMLIFMRIFARYAYVSSNRPFTGAPHDSVPRHVRIVLDILIE